MIRMSTEHLSLEGFHPTGRISRDRWKDYLVLEGLEMSQKDLESVCGERDVWVLSWTCFLSILIMSSSRKWKDGWFIQVVSRTEKSEKGTCLIMIK